MGPSSQIVRKFELSRMRARSVALLLVGSLAGCSGSGVVDAGAADSALDGGDGGDASTACTDAACLADAAVAVCGNGILDPGEACDDGNRLDTDGCTNACRYPGCGDGVVAGLGPYDILLSFAASAPSGASSLELRWNGVSVATVAVSSTSCRPASIGAVIPWNDVAPAARAYRNVLQLDAAPGVLVAYAGVAISTSSFGGWVTLVDASEYPPASPACLPAIPGPATFRAGWWTFPPGSEDCDVGATDSTTCHHCVAAYCGDGLVEPELGEECDFAEVRSTTPCNFDCGLERCGDGWLRYGFEECDDGNLVDGDGCDASCRFERCGDGVIDPTESCDDGNDIDTDACVGCMPARCGDGHVYDGVETCDDGSKACFDASCGV